MLLSDCDTLGSQISSCWHLLQQSDDGGSACDGSPVTGMAYGPGRPYISGYHRLLSSLTAAVLCVHLHVHCQPESTVVVHDSSELASALRNASIASQQSPGTTTIQLTLYSWEVSIDNLSTTVSVLCRSCKAGGRDILWLLQADQNADFFVVDRKDFPANETTDIMPGQTIILASGKCSARHHRPFSSSDNRFPSDVSESATNKLLSRLRSAWRPKDPRLCRSHKTSEHHGQRDAGGDRPQHQRHGVAPSAWRCRDSQPESGRLCILAHRHCTAQRQGVSWRVRTAETPQDHSSVLAALHGLSFT